MSPSESTSSPTDEDDVVAVSSLRQRFEALASGGSAAPLPSTSMARGGSRVVSAPIKKDMPTMKVFPAAREGKEDVEEEQSGVDFTRSLRPRVSSNPISPSLLPQPLPPSPQPSPPFHPSSMGSSSSRSSQGSSYPALRSSSSSSSLSANGVTPTQSHFPPTPNRSPPSPSRTRNGSASTPLPDVSVSKPPAVVKKAPPPPPPSRSSKPPVAASSKETSSEKASSSQGPPLVSSASRPVEEETASSVASLRSMFGASNKSSGTSTPGSSFTPPISRTTSMSSTVSSSIPPPVPTSRPALVAQLSSQPKPSSFLGEPSIPRKPSAINLSSRPPPPRPPSKAPSSTSSQSASPTELAASSTATSYAFPEILGTSTLQSTPSLPPRPKPQVPARSVVTTASLPPPTNATPNGAGDVRPKPPLPARKPTPSSGSSTGEGSVDGEGDGISQGAPPPIPGNRPILDRFLVSAPPPLPVRSKSISVPAHSESVTSAPYRPPPPPSFPPSNRLDPTRLDRSASVSSNRLGSRSSSRQTSPLPPASRELPDVNGEVYRPPPPPVRKATVAAAVEVSTPNRKSSDPVSDDEGGAHGYGSDEEDEEVDPLGPDLAYIPSSQQFKKVDDLPDPTLSNRRPPILRPHPLKMKGKSGNHHISAFASSGGSLAIGSFHLRVYNVDDPGEQGPTLLWDQKEMGLEVKSKDPKITALCFRPVADKGEEARYLWCGSKDGHLWEVDVWGSAVIQSRSNAHPTPVSAIFKYKNSVLTLDETGKACLYTMSEAGSFNINAPTQTLRIAERQSFVTVLGHQVWTSSGPLTSSSSIKTAASRGPTLRVYEPFGGESSIGAAGKVLSVPDTVTGAVLSATIIPSKPDLVYVGHEGGQVSIWSRETLVCSSVIKISTSAIISLVGIGSKLWAGTRTGTINVYDVETRPWTITNLWKAHDNTPVLGFEVDVTSIEHGHLRVYSWGRDNCVQGWDGLLSEDWQETRLVDREAEFCTYRDLTVLACTWNIDASKPVQLTGTTDNAGFLTSVLTSEESPDIIVFGFQELIDLDDKKLQAKTLLFGKSKGVNGEMSAKVSQRYQLWHDKLVQAVRVAMPPHAPYTVVHAQNLVGLFTCIFVKNAETLNLRDIAITTVKRGMAGMYGNKGAIIARFVIDDSSVCFINCHLAAGQRQKTARNADLASILDEEARFPVAQSRTEELAYAGGGDGSMILDHELCFLQGDLNYRIDLRRENVISSLRAGERAYLLEHDQLLKEMRTNSSFRLRTFNEAPIAFDPTYKYNRNSDDYDSSEKKRVPAWCDRILFRSRVPDNIEPLHYKRYEPTVSDHRPVSAGFQVKIRKVQHTPRLAVLNEIQETWEVEKAPFLHAASTFYASL